MDRFSTFISGMMAGGFGFACGFLWSAGNVVAALFCLGVCLLAVGNEYRLAKRAVYTED